MIRVFRKILVKVLGHLAERHLAERHLAEILLAERHLAERHLAEKTSCRKDILPKYNYFKNNDNNELYS